jgi:hypothetical protein
MATARLKRDGTPDRRYKASMITASAPEAHLDQTPKLASADDPVPAVGRPLRIAFLHPDLGIGGAERLVVDAALALQQCGHEVSFYTAHHDKAHCFPETRDGTSIL